MISQSASTNLQKISNHFRRNSRYYVLFFVIMVTFFGVSALFAAPSDLSNLAATKDNNYIEGTLFGAIALLLGTVAYFFTMLAGYFISAGITMLSAIGGYSNFVDVPTVVKGWVIIRDICNMLIVVIMLFIAFGTILRRDNYSLKMVPKLMMYAVLINFSRSIFGLMTDASQFIMLSFIGALPSTGGYFADAFMVKEIVSSLSFADHTNTLLAISILMGMFAAFVTLIVIWVLVAVLVYRIVQIWIYTILSPLAFLGMGFPPLGKHTSRIWTEFIDQLIMGPILAFFIWLALSTVGDSSQIIIANVVGGNASQDPNTCTGVLQFFCKGELQKYLFTVILLIGGLTVSKKFAGHAGNIVGKGLGAIDKGQGWLHKQSIGRAKDFGLRKAVQAKDAGIGLAKGADALFLAGGVSKTLEKVRGGGKTISAGAGIGAGLGMIGGPLGMAIGAGAGAAVSGFLGKHFKAGITDRLDNADKYRNARAKINTNDKGTWYSDGEHDYRKHDDGHFYKFNKDTFEYVLKDEDGEDKHVSMDLMDTDQNKGLHSKNSLEVGGKKLKEAGLRWQTAVDAYGAATTAGRPSRDAAEKEKVDKSTKQYSQMSEESVKRLIGVTGDGDQKKAMMMAIAGKLGDSDQKLIADGKKMFAGNSLLSDDFKKAMEKNASGYYRDADGVLEVKSLMRDIAKEKVKLENQDWSKMNIETLKVFAESLGDRFEKAFDNSLKTTADEKKMRGLLSKTGALSSMSINDPNSADYKNNFSIRQALANSGNVFNLAFQDDSGGVNVDELAKHLKTMKASGYKKISAEDLETEAMKDAIGKAITSIEELKKIANDKDNKPENIANIIKGALRNKALEAQIRADSKLNTYLA